jgi:predicted sulfurtransferase
MHSEENLAVLLFYAIKPLDAADEHTWQRSLCMRLSLGGRLRVAPAGLNGTLSGRRAALDEYTSAVEQRHDGVSIDWKWGDCARSELFEALAVRRVEELVSLGVPASSAPLTEAGEHLSPREFHAMLNGGAADAERPPILIDMRNAYEHALGHFQARDVETLLPPVRQFSETPRWLEAQLPLLRQRTVLMYCTGGVRCEAASAFLRCKSDGMRVLQLQGAPA